MVQWQPSHKAEKYQWNRKEDSRHDHLRLLLKRKARPNLGKLSRTLRGVHLSNTQLTPPAVALDARQQRFVRRLATAREGLKSKELHNDRTPDAL